MTTVAVTGCAGYLGRALLRRLAADPAVDRIIGIDVLQPDFRPAKLTFHRLDIRHRDVGAVLHDADVVVHLAFLLGVGHEQRLVEDVNVGGLRNLLDALESSSRLRQLVYPSSALAYGAHADNDVPLTETSPLRPNAGSVLAEHKAWSEGAIAEWSTSRPEVSVALLRLALVFGPQVDTFYSRLLESPVILGARGHESPFSIVHEEDAGSALHFAVNRRLAGAYNVCADDPVTWLELCDVAGKRGVAIPAPTLHRLVRALYTAGLVDLPPGEVDYQLHPWVMSNERLRAEGWEPAFSARHAVAEAAQAHASYVSIGVLRATRSQWGRTLAVTGAGAAAVAAAGVSLRRRAARRPPAGER